MPTLEQLRAYATEQDLVVTAALYDIAPTDRPRSQRRALMRVTHLAEEGRVAGIITPSAAHMGASTPTDRAKLGAWLTDLGAFIRCVETSEAVAS
ncbi:MULTISPECIES: hypothetical protein [unclassified Streptomyces]|uniref:hypothetical protein n=1 Tax=unclassified Streptomyces TaxID=2593676 RepID=UPI0033E0309F